VNVQQKKKHSSYRWILFCIFN